MAVYSAEGRWRSTFLDLLAILCLTQLKISLAALAQATLLTHTHLGVNWVPRPFSANWSPAGWLPACTSAWGHSSPSAGLYAFSLLTFICFSQPISPACQGPSDGSTTLSCISHSCQFCVITKLPKGICCPFIQFTNENVKEDWTQCWPCCTLLVTGLQLDFVPCGPGWVCLKGSWCCTCTYMLDVPVVHICRTNRLKVCYC